MFLYTDVNLFFGGMVALVGSGNVPALNALLRVRPLRWCGDLSYCLYIIHWFIFDTWDRLVGKYPGGLVGHFGRFGALCFRAGAVYVVCFSLAELSRRYFERPILRMKRIFT